MSPVAYGDNQKMGFKGLYLSTYRTYIYCNYVRGFRAALKQYLYGHNFKSGCKLEKVVTPFLITQDNDNPQVESNVVFDVQRPCIVINSYNNTN